MLSSAAHILTRYSHRNRSTARIQVSEEFALDAARIHELCGEARRRLAIFVASVLAGTIVWIRPGWTKTKLHPHGIYRFIDPSRLLLISLDKVDDMLWVMEEALRAGSVPLVVAEFPDPPGMTNVRRLHLAAEQGAKSSANSPVGLLLTPGTGGAPGIETRWSLEPAHGLNGSEAWALSRLRARMAPEKSWPVELRNGKLTTAVPP